LLSCMGGEPYFHFIFHLFFKTEHIFSKHIGI
jgi:hypothetical protein